MGIRLTFCPNLLKTSLAVGTIILSFLEAGMNQLVLELVRRRRTSLLRCVYGTPMYAITTRFAVLLPAC